LRPANDDVDSLMQTFFRPGNFTCKCYCRTRDETDEYNTRGREFMEALWLDCAAFLDPDALQRATLCMPTVFWELYLAHTLNSSGISLQPQPRTKQNQKGPDLFAANPDVWIEAIMPGLGAGPDAMVYPPGRGAYDTPVDSFILRLRGALRTKARKTTEYLKAGLIQPGQATVIAISGAMLPTAIGEGPVPRILKALLGVGNLVLNIDPRTGQTVSRSVEHRDEVERGSRPAVRTDPFLDPTYSHISAVVYSPCDWVTHPEKPGPDFTVIHNENASIKLQHGWLQVGDEFWREDNELHLATHSPRPTRREQGSEP
jgi:hypothetical protein